MTITDYNVFIGNTSGALTVGSYNVAVGSFAMSSGTGNAIFNVAIGYETLKVLTTGDNNVAIGRQSGGSLTSGIGNIFLGYYSGSKQVGNSNLFIR